MRLVGSLLLFIIFILIYIIILEVFTVLFRLTGMPEEKAKFQVVSMLTNSGYTTHESEIIVTVRRRRRLAMFTMIFGYAFTVTIVASIVNIFFAMSEVQLGNIYVMVIMVGVSIAAFYVLVKYTRVKQKFDKLIERVGHRLMFGKNVNSIVVLDTYGTQVMAEIQLVNVPLILDNKQLGESGIKDKYNVHLLMIKRKGHIIEKIRKETKVHQGDTIFVFGTPKNIHELFQI